MSGPSDTLIADIHERLERFRGCRDELVQRNLRLVINLALHYQGRGNWISRPGPIGRILADAGY